MAAGLHTRRCLASRAGAAAGPGRVIVCPDGVDERPTDAANDEPAAAGITELPFVDSVRLSLDAWAERARRDVEAALDEATAASFGAGREAERTAAALYDATPRSLGLRPTRDCGLNLFCHGGNLAKHLAESAYRDARADFRLRFERAVHQRATLGVDSALAQIDAAREDLHRDIDRSHAAALQAVEDTQRAFELVGTVLTVFLVFTAIKSFLYVLALVVFHERGEADVGFGAPPGPEGGYAPQTPLCVPRGFPHGLRSFALGLNQTKRLVLWKPWVAFFSRLLRLRFLMNHGTHATDGDITFPLGPGLSGVHWQLREGE